MQKLSLLAAAFAAALTFQARAGSLTYVAIPPTGSDAASGLNPGNNYTSAVDGGNTSGADRVVNGVTLSALVGSGASASASNVTFTATTGSLANAGGGSNIGADGALLDVLGAAAFVHGADPDSGPTITLAPASLTQGTTYDLRVYISGWSGQNRLVNLTFSGDGQDPVSTDFFNEDDATTSAGGFASANQVYYIDYQFTWDGSTTPGVSITQKDSHIPFHLYALTNQAVTAPAQAAADTGGGAAPAPVADNDIGNVSSDLFYTPLQSDGDWVSVSGYGRCWHPSGVSEGWRPYTNGYWANTDCGWTWVSNERWGWATDHYGRWTYIDGEGWVWVPGRVWAPAWVSWRYGGGAVGWAPLPPSARFDPGVGISIWADRSYDIGPSYYNFVAVRNFGSPNLAGVIFPPSRNVTYINSTRNITNITYNSHNTTVYNGGPNLAAVNSAIRAGGGTPIRTLALSRRQVATPGAAAGKFSQVQGNQLSLVAPSVIPKTKAVALPKIARTISAPKIDHGWSKITDPKVAAQLKAKVAAESKGLTPQNTHAKLPAGLPVVHTAVATPAATFKKGKLATTPAPTLAPLLHKAPVTPAPAVTPGSKPALEHFERVTTPAPTPHHAITPVPTPRPKPAAAIENLERVTTPAPHRAATPVPTPRERIQHLETTPAPHHAATPVPTPKERIQHLETTPVPHHAITPVPTPRERIQHLETTPAPHRAITPVPTSQERPAASQHTATPPPHARGTPKNEQQDQ